MVSALGSPLADYKIAVTDNTQLMAQFVKTPQYTQAVSSYQQNAGKISSVDDLLGNYKTLQFVLSAYGMDDTINEKGLLKQLLSEDPSQTTSLAQKLGDSKYLAFAKDFWSLSTDGGKAISDPLNMNKTIARYGQTQYAQWLATTDNDQTLSTALDARAQMQDAIDISNVGALYTTFQNSNATQATIAHIKAALPKLTTPQDLLADKTTLNAALTAYGLDPTKISSDTVSALLTQNPLLPSSVAAQNPQYQDFAVAFDSLQLNGGEALHTSTVISNLVDRYTQSAFTQAITTNTADQNVQMFGAKGAAQITDILNDAKVQNGLDLTASYYAAHAQAAKTAQAFMADTQLTSVALGAFGFSSADVSSDVLQKLLTQSPADPSSLAQTEPQYAAFANAFSFASGASGSARTSTSGIASITAAFDANQLKGMITADITASQEQSTRNTQDGEKADAPLNLYQMLANSNMSSVLFGAYGLPAQVGGYDPDEQIQLMHNAGFQADSLKTMGDTDKLIQRYLAQESIQLAPSDPVLSLFQSMGSSQPIALDLSFLTAGDTQAASAPNAYLLNLL